MAKALPIPKPLPPDAGGRFERRLSHRYFVRCHMAVILAAVTASGVLASKGLLELGVHSLRLRYPLAVSFSYLVFLGLVRVWIWYVTLHSPSAPTLGSLDPTGGGGGFSGGGGDGFAGFGGGSSGGGGASDTWDAAVSEAAPAPSKGSGWLPSLDLDLDADDGLVILLLVALVLGILGGAGYLVYAAPQILPEAAWQAVLATTLTRVSKEEHHDWMRGVLRSTWLSFSVVLVLAGALGWAAHRHCPSATKLAEVFHCVLQ